MEHRLVRPWRFYILIGLLSTLNGCGLGLSGADDVQGDTCSIGPALPFQPTPMPEKPVADRLKSYLLRGLQNKYSLGLDRLAEEMRIINLPTTIVEYPNWQASAERIAQEYPTWPPDSRLVLVGHSYGADDAVLAAKLLKERGVPVDLLYLLDATKPLPIPDNVVRCVHLFGPSIIGLFFPNSFAGNPVVPEASNDRTRIINIPFIVEIFGSGVGCANHFSIDANTLAHNFVIEEVLHLLEPDTYPEPDADKRFARGRPPSEGDSP
jgi:pimeloyl-ACP methyl ester carboxylesterase